MNPVLAELKARKGVSHNGQSNLKLLKIVPKVNKTSQELRMLSSAQCAVCTVYLPRNQTSSDLPYRLRGECIF